MVNKNEMKMSHLFSNSTYVGDSILSNSSDTYLLLNILCRHANIDFKLRLKSVIIFVDFDFRKSFFFFFSTLFLVFSAIGHLVKFLSGVNPEWQRFFRQQIKKLREKALAFIELHWVILFQSTGITSPLKFSTLLIESC